MKEKIKQKKFIQILALVVIIIGCSIYFLTRQNQQQNKQQDIQNEKQDVQGLLADLTKAVNMVEGVENKLPKELLEVHQYLVNQIQNKKLNLVVADSKLKDLVMYHGVKTGSIYVNTSVKFKPELWIPVFYHESAHNYWRTRNPATTLEEFEESLFGSENYAYTVSAQAWNIVINNFPVQKDESKTELEQRFFKLYSDEAEVYNEMIKNNPEAEELWERIIEENIKFQKEQ